jgi:hypothetical protein
VHVATGYSGNGMTIAHIAAITLSDQILKGSSPVHRNLNPNRITPFWLCQFVKENLDVVKSSLANGEPGED